jgi:hypothetical protein
LTPTALNAAPRIPLHSGTFSLHALTPLYHPDGLLRSPSFLKFHAERLRTYLKRDSLLPNAINDPVASKTGILQTCTWSALSPTSAWDRSLDNHPLTVPRNDNTFGILITLTYSTAQIYTAILVHDQPNNHNDSTSIPPQPPPPPGFQSYPLLLSRLPTPIRTPLLSYLSSTFDTFPTQLKLPPRFITPALETYLSILTTSKYTYALPTDIHESAHRVTTIIKDLQLSFSFPTAAPGLKTLDVTVERHDTVKFLAKTLSSSSPSGASPERQTAGFMSSLFDHLTRNTAIDFAHPDVKLVKVSCGAFVLGGPMGEGGRIKFLAGARGGDTEEEEGDRDGEAVRRANTVLMEELLRWAKG